MKSSVTVSYSDAVNVMYAIAVATDALRRKLAAAIENAIEYDLDEVTLEVTEDQKQALDCLLSKTVV